MVPVEDKSPPHNLKLDLNLDQTDNAATASSLSPSAKILNFERQQHIRSALHSPPKPKLEAAQRPKTLVKPKETADMDTQLAETSGSILASSSVSGASSDEGRKVKMSKIGTTKTAALKRYDSHVNWPGHTFHSRFHIRTDLYVTPRDPIDLQFKPRSAFECHAHVRQ